ncbi:MAG TPA: S28 family serine protease [Kofleriaceae bacterium]|nr:S28 family serine protease [Kofleriaceae bacterium]
MHRLLLLACVVAACGDNLETPGVEEPPRIEAVCDEGQLDTLVAALPDVTSVQPTSCGAYVETGVKCYRVTISQPLNHAAPDRTFDQWLFVMHRGCDRPTVVADWGYSNDVFFDDELAVLFQANAIWIEHRYQGQSTPAAADWDWTQLTIENGANDVHHVIESFKHLYGANWVSTGASKGGITATYHSFFFPDDLDGAIPYVAPASRARVDPAYQTYLDGVLTTPCAQQIRDTQVAALTTRRTMMLAHLTEVGAVGFEADYLDAMTASFDWGFWQYYGERYCNRVPAADASDDAFWSFYANVSGIQRMTPGDPALSDGALSYEWLTEQGFALQIGAHVRPLLQSELATMTMEDRFRSEFPDVDLPRYDGYVTRAARHWAKQSADSLLLIYGQYDPWSGGALDEPERPTSARFFAPAQTHGGAQIATLTDEDRTAALAIAERMFGVPPAMTLMQRAAEAGQRRDEIVSGIERRHLMRMPR